MTLVDQAQSFATEAHAAQSYGEHPYTAHLARVVAILRLFGHGDDDLLAAGWLHDSMEDTETLRQMLEEKFGQEVADLVAAVTDEPGKNRRERHVRTYPKIRAKDRAILLKLADRIANVEASWDTRDPKLFMYQREYREFREALRDPGDTRALPMWDHLDKLLGWWEPPVRPAQ